VDHIIRHTKRTLVGILGGLVVLIGIILIPYPGPGWLVVFAGLTLLATEFAFAEKWLLKLRTQYEKWLNTYKRQHGAIRAGALLLTCTIVVATVWLVNGLGIANSVLNLHLDWLTSPIFS
jgi:uncharacterized protein (TIGR02611 family)